MLSVTACWPDGQWALILGINREQFDGIWDGAQLSTCIKNLPQRVVAPVLFILMRYEDAVTPELYDQIIDGAMERYPDEDLIIPIFLNEECRMALEDHKAVQFPTDVTFRENCPTGWIDCRFIEVRFRETEADLVESLQGKRIDLR